MLYYLHIITGTAALVSGTIAFSVKKGSFLHKKSGLVFVVTMLFLSSSGALLAVLKSELITVIAGCLTFYLVATAFLAARPIIKHSKLAATSLMFFSFAIGVFGLFTAYCHLSKGNMVIDGQPIQALFVFSAIALIASVFDFRVIFINKLQGKQKLIRHIWRIGLAMLIAVVSLFLGQSQVFPEAMRSILFLVTPVLLVLFLTIYWLVRVQFWGLVKRT